MIPRELLPTNDERNRGLGAVLILIAADVLGSVALGAIVWAIFQI